MENTPGITDTWTRPTGQPNRGVVFGAGPREMPAWETPPAKTKRPGDLFRHIDSTPSGHVPLESTAEPKTERKGFFGWLEWPS
jgi:hypothetical protein